MVRRLASKKWMDRVPDSAMRFLGGMGCIFVVLILYYLSGPPSKGLIIIVVAVAIVFGIGAVNDFIFMKKDRYKNIVEYYESKYASRPPWPFYFIIPICYIILMFCFSLVHDHYAYYDRINGLK
jgi:ABC-type Fe3+-siderophore transport system permease subunit